MAARQRVAAFTFIAVLATFFAWAAHGAPRSEKPLEIGANRSLQGRRIFPADDPWNRDISAEAVDPDSDALIASIGGRKPLHPDFGTVYNGAPSGIPYVVVPGDQPRVPVTFDYKDESDPGPYPIPPAAPIEGGPAAKGDRHVLVVDRDHWKLYELWSAYPLEGGKSWKAGSGAIFDLASGAARPAGWTSADAAGLPVLPGLVRYDEVVEQGRIDHALRFTVARTRHAYVAPARHSASPRTDPHLPPMGMRARLKIRLRHFEVPPCGPRDPDCPEEVRDDRRRQRRRLVYQRRPDPRWNDAEIETLKRVKGTEFEVIKMGQVVTH